MSRFEKVVFFPIPIFLLSYVIIIEQCIETSQIKHIVKACVTRRSAHDTGGIPTLAGWLYSDVGTETEWITDHDSPVATAMW